MYQALITNAAKSTEISIFNLENPPKMKCDSNKCQAQKESYQGKITLRFRIKDKKYKENKNNINNNNLNKINKNNIKK